MRSIFAVLSIFIALTAAHMQAQNAIAASLDTEEAENSGESQPVSTLTIVERLSQPSSGVTVDAPASLMQRAMRQSAAEKGASTVEEDADDHDAERVVRTKSGKIVGYRVQVFADNNARSAKVEARQRERAVGQAFPSYATYVSYASPYWRLRVGDFRSQYDAEKAADQIRKAFPRYAREVRVVRDRISVK